MTLRLRLTLGLGAAFVLIWSLAATWMLFDLRREMMSSLDQRLAASARMVAGLAVQLPETEATRGRDAALTSEQLGITNGLACQISSLRGEVLLHSQSTPGPLMDAGFEGFQNQTIDNIPWRSFTIVQGGLRITTADRLDERTALERSLLLTAAVPVLAALLGSLALLWIGLGRGLAPLRQIRLALARRSPDATDPLPTTGLPSELTPLVEAQNHLFLRIGDALARERRLTDDAAHELRSPLTAIKTHLQVAAMTDGEASRSALEQAELGADRLQHILDQLLLLARVEGNLPFDEGMSCRPLEVARQAVAYAGQGEGPTIEMIHTGDPSDAHLAIPPVLAVVALRNLLENARRHTPPDTRVRLEVSRHAQRSVIFRVRDYGNKPSRVCTEKLTRRFWRGPQSQGSGLGLSIVKAIADRCDCTLQFVAHADGLEVSLDIKLCV